MVKKENNDVCKDNSPFVAIPASLGGIYLVIVALFVFFAKDMLSQVVSIIWGFVVLGIAALFFAYKAKK